LRPHQIFTGQLKISQFAYFLVGQVVFKKISRVSPYRKSFSFTIFIDQGANIMASILLIDDDAKLGSIIRMVFYNHNVQFSQAHSAVEGLNWARAQQPDVMIVDLLLPDLPGEWALVEAIRRDELLRMVPLVVISGFDPDQDKIARYAVSAYFQKPFSSADLRGHVLNLITPA
jgi:CheY-like chemotaxis protein